MCCFVARLQAARLIAEEVVTTKFADLPSCATEAGCKTRPPRRCIPPQMVLPHTASHSKLPRSRQGQGTRAYSVTWPGCSQQAIGWQLLPADWQRTDEVRARPGVSRDLSTAMHTPSDGPTTHSQPLKTPPKSPRPGHPGMLCYAAQLPGEGQAGSTGRTPR